jgi:predicted nucleic acid-binding protein
MRVSRATRHLERVGRVVAPTHEDWVTAGTVQGRIRDDDIPLRSKRLLHDLLIVCAARRVGAILITENAGARDRPAQLPGPEESVRHDEGGAAPG